MGLGEGASRLATFGVVVWIAREFGTAAVGIFALGQVAFLYGAVGSELGLRAIGARLVAIDSGHAALVMRTIVRKRCLLAPLATGACALYALYGPMPDAARVFVFAFALSLIPHVFLVDWALWGMERFDVLCAVRIVTAAIFALGTVAGVYVLGSLLAVPAASFLSLAVAAAGLWLFWMRKRPAPPEAAAERIEAIRRETSWSSAGALGAALLLNQTAHSVDTLMLGAMGTAGDVGLYNAAYKPIALVMGAYAMVIQALYPALARRQGAVRPRVLRAGLWAFLIGSAIAAAVAAGALPIVRSIYGPAFEPAHVPLRILVLTIPLDLAAALFATAITAWGMVRAAVVGTGLAATSNATLGLVLIPSLGTAGAAWANVTSAAVALVVFACYLAVPGRRAVPASA